MMLEWTQIRYVGIMYLILVASLTLHEYAHAWVADWLGDPTPRQQGRTSLNPIVHMDILGTVILPIYTLAVNLGGLLMGWGKPVLIDPSYFKNKVWGDIACSLAGPLVNLLLAAAVVLVGSPLMLVAPRIGGLLLQIVALNCALAVFNLLPLPPLDGGCILRHGLRLSDTVYQKIAQWSFVIILVLINISAFRQALGMCIQILIYGMLSIAKGLYNIPVSAFCRYPL